MRLQEILPLYFKHGNLRSFIRQLNIYGFQRVANVSSRTHDSTLEFQHPMFTRDSEHNLARIKRGCPQPEKGEVEAQLPPAAKRQYTGLQPLALQQPASQQVVPQPPGRSDTGQRGDHTHGPVDDYASCRADMAVLKRSLADFQEDMKAQLSLFSAVFADSIYNDLVSPH